MRRAEDRDMTGRVSHCNGESTEQTKCQREESRKQKNWTQEKAGQELGTEHSVCLRFNMDVLLGTELQ